MFFSIPVLLFVAFCLYKMFTIGQENAFRRGAEYAQELAEDAPYVAAGWSPKKIREHKIAMHAAQAEAEMWEEIDAKRKASELREAQAESEAIALKTRQELERQEQAKRTQALTERQRLQAAAEAQRIKEAEARLDILFPRMKPRN